MICFAALRSMMVVAVVLLDAHWSLGQITVSASAIVTPESSRVAAVKLKLSEVSQSPVRLTCTTSGGTAISGVDFVARTSVVTFPVGVVERSLNVTVRDDLIAEPDQEFTVLLSQSTGATIATPVVKITIQDNDPDPIVSLGELAVTEGSGGGFTTAQLDIRLSQRSEKPIRFTLSTTPNTATAQEFASFSTRMLFGSSTNLFRVPIRIVADDDLEGQQRFYMTLANPQNCVLNFAQLSPTRTDRIRSTVIITDDDVLVPPLPIQSKHAFAWIGAFGRAFTEDELDAISLNHDFVVIAKFHASFSIEQHHADAVALRLRKPDQRILPYFNAKFWFHHSQWGTSPDPHWLLRDPGGSAVVLDTDRSPANYLDLRQPECREWILETIDGWFSTGLYDGIAFDSANPVGDFNGGSFWNDLLGGPSEIVRWNDGLAHLLTDAQSRFAGKIVLFNGLAKNASVPQDGALWRLTLADGALNEKFAIDLNGLPTSSLRSEIDLIESSPNKVFLCKSNLRDTGDVAKQSRAGRFAYAAFLMGHQPGASFFKFAVDDFYTTSELEDDPPEMQIDLGVPTEFYQADGMLLSRRFERGEVGLNLGATPIVWNVNDVEFTIPGYDALFIRY